MGTKVTVRVIDGRSYVDIFDLLRGIESEYGTLISKDKLRKHLMELDEVAQNLREGTSIRRKWFESLD